MRIAQGLQFGLQLRSSLAPQRLAHPLASIPHLERGHMGVPFGCRHPRMAEHLLDHADVDALLDQQRRAAAGRANSARSDDRAGSPAGSRRSQRRAIFLGLA